MGSFLPAAPSPAIVVKLELELHLIWISTSLFHWWICLSKYRIWAYTPGGQIWARYEHFWKLSIRKCSDFGQKMAKNGHFAQPKNDKMTNFDRTPAFHMRVYHMHKSLNFRAIHKWCPIFWHTFWPTYLPLSDFEKPTYIYLKIGRHLWMSP